MINVFIFHLLSVSELIFNYFLADLLIILASKKIRNFRFQVATCMIVFIIYYFFNLDVKVWVHSFL